MAACHHLLTLLTSLAWLVPETEVYLGILSPVECVWIRCIFPSSTAAGCSCPVLSSSIRGQIWVDEAVHHLSHFWRSKRDGVNVLELLKGDFLSDAPSPDVNGHPTISKSCTPGNMFTLERVKWQRTKLTHIQELITSIGVSIFGSQWAVSWP